MNTTGPNQDIGEDDHVEVLVEDLFIEEYDPPLTLAPEPSKRGGRLASVTRPLRDNAPSLLGGLAALGGLVLLTIFFSARRKKIGALQRLFLRFGIAR